VLRGATRTAQPLMPVMQQVTGRAGGCTQIIHSCAFC